jgi:hypothetical protein
VLKWKVAYGLYNYKGGPKGNTFVLLFSGMPNVSKKIGDGPIKVAPSLIFFKKRIKL